MSSRRPIDQNPENKFWFLIKVGIGAILLSFALLVIFVAVITGDRNALIGLVFPGFLSMLLLILWGAHKVYDNDKDNIDE